jgi:GT2 family glycosyltransferase
MACLQSLARLDYPRDRFEVIVVDDGSPSPPEDLVDSFRGGLDVTLLRQPHAGPAAARNAGAARASGDYLAFTDDDCAPAADWLKALAARFVPTPGHGVGGRTVNALPENLFSTASHQLIGYLYDYYNAEPGGARFLASNNLALPAEGFRAAGGFDTTFPRAAGEDREFCDRWRHYGYRLTYAPEAVVYHAHALSFHHFWRQHFGYGSGAYHFHQLRASRAQERIRFEPMAFYLSPLRYPFSHERGWRALALAGLLVVSQVANAAGFFCERFQQAVEKTMRSKLGS